MAWRYFEIAADEPDIVLSRPLVIASLTAITNAATPKLTVAVDDGYNGMLVCCEGVLGMTEINNQVFHVHHMDLLTPEYRFGEYFEDSDSSGMASIDTSTYGVYAGGGTLTRVGRRIERWPEDIPVQDSVYVLYDAALPRDRQCDALQRAKEFFAARNARGEVASAGDYRLAVNADTLIETLSVAAVNLTICPTLNADVVLYFRGDFSPVDAAQRAKENLLHLD